jgi:hypothetical protein
MSAITLSHKQLQGHQQIITGVILPKLGFNRHTPASIVYAPQHFGGIGLHDLYIEQGLAKINFITEHLRTTTDITNTIVTLKESHMINTGSNHSPFHESSVCPYVHAPWIESLQQFLRHTGLSSRRQYSVLH